MHLNLEHRLLPMIALICFLPFYLNGQVKSGNPYLNNKQENPWLIEGIVGFQFGTISMIELSPNIGYRFSSDFVAGVGFTYQYNRYKDYYLNLTNNQTENRVINILGGRVFARYYLRNWFDGILGRLFVHTEFEQLYYSRDFELDANGDYIDSYGYPYSRGNEKIDVSGLLVGGGINQPLGRHTYANILILYNLNETHETPYSNPIIRIGFGAGF